MCYSEFRIRDYHRRLEMARQRYPGGVAEAWAKLGIPIPRLAAELFEAMPERFMMGDLCAVVDDAAQHAPDGSCADLSHEDLLELVQQWRSWEMISVEQGGGEAVYTKTDIRPYTMDKGYFTGSDSPL